MPLVFICLPCIFQHNFLLNSGLPSQQARNLKWILGIFFRGVNLSLRSKNDSAQKHICTLSQLHMDSSKRGCLK